MSEAAADLEWCHEAVEGVSRTFALTIDVLDEPMSSYICVGYLLCRIADTVEDAHHIPPETQATLLRTYHAVLDPDDPTGVETFTESVAEWIPEDGERTADWEVVARTPRVVRTFERQPDSVIAAIRPPVLELVSGMALFVERYADSGGLRIRTRTELEEYCYYAAGTVGLLITNLICRNTGPPGEETEGVDPSVERTLYENAESFGLLLQLVNIAKDVYDDYHEEDNVYLPATWLDAEGVPQERVLAAEYADGSTAVVKRTAEHARTFLDDAQRYLETLPEVEGNRLAAWAIPYLLAVGTLRELSARPEDALSERDVKVSRSEVGAIVSRMLGETDSALVGDLRTRIAARPFDQA
ncbi:farnesyl-diphosphate farnesyltransferase [Halalkalicoccus jeotgali B3]|uniref:Farnesyl-diphosphate farnesyltransferase n=1 Tax=Halalkalicoccus jeotgali (strain DSM 18796 / CECT 7217 / JCM 14584 / KCTC 4019 / B3) TaxID=795797 RepID=D8J5I0_HALJB|nr:farnesyl-diphosphate farnesyltransferase [Halalkalicoccus jeotgali B3]ELY36554.1 farnesyl-diphosphate farnesyltransferase [Halalkalicoccus jeotgali B3]